MRDVDDSFLGMSHSPSLPNLKVGCLWTPRPKRSLRSLTSESYIPILNPSNIRHFILLAKYRPPISFFKGATAWDWAALKANARFENTLVPTNFLTEQEEGKGDNSSNIAKENLVDLQIEDTVTEICETSQLPGIKETTFFSVQTPISAKRPGSAGWPDLHTARRCLTRQKPRGKVSNEEMYASLRKPSTVDILGSDWKARHKKSQTHLLKRCRVRSLQTSVSLNICRDQSSSRLSSATQSLTSSNMQRPNTSRPSSTKTPLHKSLHVVTYTPVEEPIVKDLLPSNWKEQHKKRQAHLLHVKEERERNMEILGTARSITQAAASILDADLDRLSTDTTTFMVTKVDSRPSVTSTNTFILKRPLSPAAEPDELTEEKPAKRKSNIDHQQRLEAEIGILKDWIRTQLPATVAGGKITQFSSLQDLFSNPL